MPTLILTPEQLRGAGILNSIELPSGGGGGNDPDAQAFLTAATITDPTEISAVNQLVLDLKAANIWTKMKAVYPFVGGTATTHKWNLINPVDSDAAFRLTFNGGWTHSSDGALPNGTNAYANTYLFALTELQQFNHHHSFYHNTDNIGTGLRQFGGVRAGTNTDFRTAIENSGTAITFRSLGGATGDVGYTASTIKGFRASSRIANNDMFQIKQDGTTTTPFTTPTITALPNYPCFLAAFDSGGVPQAYGAMQVAFHSIGDGLTASEGLDLRNAVQTFQTTLGRAV